MYIALRNGKLEYGSVHFLEGDDDSTVALFLDTHPKMLDTLLDQFKNVKRVALNVPKLKDLQQTLLKRNFEFLQITTAEPPKTNEVEKWMRAKEHKLKVNEEQSWEGGDCLFHDVGHVVFSRREGRGKEFEIRKDQITSTFLLEGFIQFWDIDCSMEVCLGKGDSLPGLADSEPKLEEETGAGFMSFLYSAPTPQGKNVAEKKNVIEEKLKMQKPVTTLKRGLGLEAQASETKRTLERGAPKPSVLESE